MKHLTKDERNCQQYCVNGFIVGMFDDGLNPTVKDCRDSFDSYNWDGLTDKEIQTIIDAVEKYYTHRDARTYLKVNLNNNRLNAEGHKEDAEIFGFDFDYDKYLKEEDAIICSFASKYFGIDNERVEQIVKELGL